MCRLDHTIFGLVTILPCIEASPQWIDGVSWNIMGCVNNQPVWGGGGGGGAPRENILKRELISCVCVCSTYCFMLSLFISAVSCVSI